jgi:hypothetical protein
MRKIVFVAAALCVAFPAAAQHTTCMAHGNMLNCNTTGGESAQQYDYEGQRVLGAAIGNLLAGNPRKKAIKALEKGDCFTAQRLAIKTGDDQFFQQIRQVCTDR